MRRGFLRFLRSSAIVVLAVGVLGGTPSRAAAAKAAPQSAASGWRWVIDAIVAVMTGLPFGATSGWR
jgi:hypothetical protein